jgi:hypothetical protein
VSSDAYAFYAQPTGNGYADKTIDALGRIERRIKIVEGRHSHMEDLLVHHLTTSHDMPPKRKRTR